MNKTKLEVIRINEDVIATSSNSHFFFGGDAIARLKADTPYPISSSDSSYIEETWSGPIQVPKFLNKYNITDQELSSLNGSLKFYVYKNGKFVECDDPSHGSHMYEE